MKPQFVAPPMNLSLFSASAATAQPSVGTEPCIIRHRFEPDPIVNGHRRQTTPGEVEA
jgi:hypothetical protein